jgi:hypothetical protein
MMLLPLVAAAMFLQPKIVIDDFESVSQWRAMPSDDVTLKISHGPGVNGKSIRIDFDFHGHGGYAVIRRDVKLELPANYEFSWSIRGEAPVNTLEFKLVDPSGDNVWWSNQPGYVFPADWRKVVRKKRHITFAWGPAGGGEMKNVAGIEIAITAGTGGKGTVWIDDLELAPLPQQGPYSLTPKMTVGEGPTGPRWLDIDFLQRREFGGLVIDRGAWNYTVGLSQDGQNFTEVFRSSPSLRTRDYLYLPESDARYVRLTFPDRPPRVIEALGIHGLKAVNVMPLEWAANKNTFFNAVADDAPPGTYPRYFTEKQSYWTVIGVSGDTREGMINEQGMIESGKGQFSIEPFVGLHGQLITWADATRTIGLLDGDLPIPFVRWTTPSIELTITSFASGPPDSSVLYARYRIRSVAQRPEIPARLFLGIRPFQVNPPWQFLNTTGGFAHIDSIAWDRQIVRINSDRHILPLTNPAGFTAMAFSRGNVVDFMKRIGGTGRWLRPALTESAVDTLGGASGALWWDLRLRPGSDTTIDVAIPLHTASPGCSRNAPLTECGKGWAASQLKETAAIWRKRLDVVDINLPQSASRIANSIRANLAWILINRDGPSIQPGSRSYERSWIRDGALTSAALLRLGQYNEVREFIDWYAKYQFENGKIPCCVDSRGADPVPENDSHGEFIYLVAEYFRHTGDRALLERLWPNVSRAHAFMDSLRHSRRTPEFQTGEKRVFYGLMPQSISHEGYSAKPMHSYWDDFFALRGFKDAAEIAQTLGKPQAKAYAAARDEFRNDFYASIRLSMQQHKIDYIPGAAELGDFDATSTTIALNPADELSRLPQPALNRTFDKYYENFRNRRDSANWEIYTPYEWRTVGTFVRLGQKARAHEIADFFFQHQRPKEWHHWAEVVWRDPDTPKFIGDMPHTWVGSDFIRSTLDMFAYEREADSSLVIGAGITERWAREANGVGIRGLSTHYGRLSFTMRYVGDEVEVRLEPGIRIPKGGLVVTSPAHRPAARATVDGRSSPLREGSVVVRALPAVVRFRY